MRGAEQGSGPVSHQLPTPTPKPRQETRTWSPERAGNVLLVFICAPTTKLVGTGTQPCVLSAVSRVTQALTPERAANPSQISGLFPGKSTSSVLLNRLPCGSLHHTSRRVCDTPRRIRLGQSGLAPSPQGDGATALRRG